MGPCGVVTSYGYEKVRGHATSVTPGHDVVKSRDDRYHDVDPVSPFTSSGGSRDASMDPMKKTLAASLTVSVLVMTAACGGGGRPSVDELRDSMVSGDTVIPVPEQAAECFAEVLVDSDLSDETLQAIVEQDEDYEGSDEEQGKLQDLSADVVEQCAGELGAE